MAPGQGTRPAQTPILAKPKPVVGPPPGTMFFVTKAQAQRMARPGQQVAFHNGAPLYLELPVTVELVVTHTEPGLQGDRSSAGTKPATVETGATVAVPLFISTGEKIKVDTRDGRYLGRA